MFWKIVWTLVSLTGLFFAWAIGLGMLRKRNHILNTPVRQPGKVSSGMACLEGRARAAQAYTSPFTNKSVAFCKATAKQMYIDSKGKVDRKRFDLRYEESSAQYPFLLEDATGSVLVKTSDAFVDINDTYAHDNYEWGVKSVTAKSLPPIATKLLEDEGVIFETPRGPAPIELREACIEEGENVFVYGEVSSNQKEIDDVLSALEEPLDKKVKAIVRSGKRRAEELYVTKGDMLSATSSLLRVGTNLLIVGNLVGVGFGAIAYFMWTG